MATYNSNQFASVSGSPTRSVAGTDFEARVRAFVGTITLPSGVAAGDVVKLFKLPAGVRVVDFVIHKTGSAAFTVDIGVAGDTTKFVSAASLGSGTAAVLAGSRSVAALSDDTVVQAVLGGTPAASQVLTVVARYTAP